MAETVKIGKIVQYILTETEKKQLKQKDCVVKDRYPAIITNVLDSENQVCNLRVIVDGVQSSDMWIQKVSPRKEEEQTGCFINLSVK